MSTMWSMCSMSTGHCSTQAPHVVHDHAALLGGADQRTCRLLRTVRGHPLESGLRDVVLFIVLRLDEAAVGRLELLAHGVIAGDVLVAQDVWRLGEHVVAQIHDNELGRQRLSG